LSLQGRLVADSRKGGCVNGLPSLAMLLSVMTTIAGAGLASAQEAARPFYQGKVIQVLSPYDGGGIYPQLAQALANYLPKYIPGRPGAVPQFMPGAGGLKMANYMARIAPKDGTVIALLFDGTPSAQLLYADQGVNYNVDEFIPIGTVTRGDTSVVIVRADSPVKTIADVMGQEVVVGGAAAGAGNVVVPRGLNFALGTRFRVLTGYPTMGSILLAMEQREVDATVINWSNLSQLKPDWIADHKLRVLAQVGVERHKDLHDIPLLLELTNDDKTRQALRLISANSMSGKGFVTTPGVPAERVEILRKGFMAVMRDPEFVELMTKQKVDLDPQPPAFLADIFRQILSTDPQIVKAVRTATDKQ
jgi:tripartite-type tricarboxylate transporter receptor subunit TctC